MSTSIEIVQRAMILADLTPIEGFDEESEKADSVTRLWTNKRQALLTEHPWHFASKLVQLSREVAVPAAKWAYQFTMPPDRLLSPMTVLTSPDPGVPPYQRFEIVGNKLMSDATELWAKYVFEVEPSLWPPYFADFAQTDFAADICKDDRRRLELRQDARGLPGEARRGGMFASARRADARFAPAKGPLSNDGGPLIRARLGG